MGSRARQLAYSSALLLTQRFGENYKTILGPDFLLIKLEIRSKCRDEGFVCERIGKGLSHAGVTVIADDSEHLINVKFDYLNLGRAR